MRSRGVINGQAVGPVDSGQDQRIQAEGRAAQHPQDERARREKGSHIALCEVEVARTKQAHQGDEWEDDSPGALGEARVDLRLHEERSNAGEDRQGDDGC